MTTTSGESVTDTDIAMAITVNWGSYGGWRRGWENNNAQGDDNEQ